MLDNMVDVLILGAGLSGVMTALHLPSSLNVLMVSKGDITQTNSYLAQGGVAAVVTDDDSPMAHYEDTLVCGHNANDEEAVKQMVFEAKSAIEEIVENYNVAFDKDEKGYLLGMEGAHSKARILRMGDFTGKALMDTLYPHVQAKGNVKHLTGVTAVSLIVEAQRCIGVWAYVEGVLTPLYAKAVLMATGGVGQLFPHTTNAVGVVGDGIAMALKAKVTVNYISNLQFHPTGFYSKQKSDRHFLISEAVRGEGAKLYNHSGIRFMENIHPMKELAPRDVVAKAIHQEMKREGKPHVWLDVTHLEDNFLRERFPTIYTRLSLEGYVMSSMRIPCVPCLHYYMGGIEARPSGETSLVGLYALGECAFTGVHGKNRLASNSLLEILVFSKKVSMAMNDFVGHSIMDLTVQAKPLVSEYPLSMSAVKALYQQYLSLGADLNITHSGLERVDSIFRLKSTPRQVTQGLYEVENALLVLKAMLFDQIKKGEDSR